MRRNRGLARVALRVAAAAVQANAATRDDRADSRPLPFLSDDYGRALADARARALPLFIEAWAPW